jgi:hypothetical protein
MQDSRVLTHIRSVSVEKNDNPAILLIFLGKGSDSDLASSKTYRIQCGLINYKDTKPLMSSLLHGVL